jgi:hypothetical protein
MGVICLHLLWSVHRACQVDGFANYIQSFLALRSKSLFCGAVAITHPVAAVAGLGVNVSDRYQLSSVFAVSEFFCFCQSLIALMTT